MNFSGLAINEQNALGAIHIARGRAKIEFEKSKLTSVDERKRFTQATKRAQVEIADLQKQVLETWGSDKAEIFSAQAEMIADPEWIEMVEKSIDEGWTSESSVEMASQNWQAAFARLDNPYLRERAQDVVDIARRLTRHLGGNENDIATGNVGSVADSNKQPSEIWVFDTITASDVVALPRDRVRGILCASGGGGTSHAAILLRSSPFAAVFGLGNEILNWHEGSWALVDGPQGKVQIDSQELLHKKFNELQAQQSSLEAFAKGPTLTSNGTRVLLYANINALSDADLAVKMDVDGVGLFRTEFLFFDKVDLPSEEEQFEAYKKILQAFDGKPVTIRTFDIGGDKPHPRLQMKVEANPFLGVRGVRLYKTNLEAFDTQMTALIRASAFGNLRIMIPMITSPSEWQWVVERTQVLLQKLNMAKNFALGMMVEVPAAALALDRFAPSCEFFSIGSNDLMQYCMAIDRTNDDLNELADAFHPGFLRILEYVVERAAVLNRPVSICGELASDTRFLPELVRMRPIGLSVGPTRVLRVRSVIAKL